MKNLILLHGALGNHKQFDTLASELEKQFHIHRFDFPGHDGTQPVLPFTIEQYSGELGNYITNNLAGITYNEIAVFGYSMGGYVALHHERNSPGRIGKIMTLGTKFDWNPDSSALEASMLKPQKMKNKIPAFVQTLIDKFGEHNWENVVNATAKMMLELGDNPALRIEDYGDIECSVQIMVGDKDVMVSLEESIAVYRRLKNASLAVLPNVIHPIDRIRPKIIITHITDFLLD
ncbi:MAG: alpha/beta hydrolase [Ignavibacteriae bacterium HGW-Ignavibacteriae-1]|jgi:pimeloyl-ACP methyl ester carboxylesterase|nr:MAG: alpha/beta hydrolase [Ignavibacteriae bacterium HGW-Ignavibacteriae-1]